MTDDRIFQLPTREIPKKWLNIQPSLPEPVPPMLSPADGKPVPLEAFVPLFPMGLLEQEVSQEREIIIPDEVLKVYSLFRPTPLIRAKFLEEVLGTPAMIFFKNESVTPTGSHKPNTAIAQAYYNKKEGVKKLVTETGAGQWGSALAFAGAHFDLDINVFMVRASYEQKPYRKIMMESYGAKVHPSPTKDTQIGKKMLEDKRNYPGSLGIAISEAVEVAATSGGTVKYALGSVLNHVLMHQTVIGLEARAVLEDLGLYPDVVIACHGGGKQLRRHRHSLHGGQDLGQAENRVRRLRASCLPVSQQGNLCLRFRGLGKAHSARQDVHAGPRVHPAVRARGRASLSRRCAHRVPSEQQRPDPGRGPAAEGDIRGRGSLRPHGRNNPRAGVRACNRLGHPRGKEVQGDRGEEGDPFQPLRSRPLRHAGV